MAQTVAGIDVHKKLLVVVIVDRAQPEVVLQSGKFGAGSAELGRLSGWLRGQGVAEAVMESTAQYWKPVWMELEPHLRLHLAQAQSNKAPKGRKSDLADAKRLVRRFLAGELMLSFIPEPEQRGWRMITRGRLQLVRERVQVQNQIESLLEEGRIKLSSVVSDLLGASGKRILRALADGESNPETLAMLGDKSLKCGLPALIDALTGEMHDIHRRLLSQHLDRIRLIDEQVEELSKLAAAQMQNYQQEVRRLVEIPGIGATAAQEILAEIGPQASAFPSAPQLASWVGVCPGPRRAPARIIPAAPPKGTASCAESYAKRLKRRPAPTAATCKRSSNASLSAWATSRPSGPLLIASARSSGTSSTKGHVLSNSAKPEIRRPSKELSIIISELFAGSAIPYPP